MGNTVRRHATVYVYCILTTSCSYKMVTWSCRWRHNSVVMSQGMTQSLNLPLPITHRTPSTSPTPSLRTGSCRSPEVTSLTTEEPNGGVDNEDGQAVDDFEEKAFFVLRKTTRPRNWCITAVMWPYPLRAVFSSRQQHCNSHTHTPSQQIRCFVGSTLWFPLLPFIKHPVPGRGLSRHL